MPGKITISRQSQQTQLDDTGQVRTFVRIDFRVGNDGPFNISIPQDQFNPETVYQQLNDFAEKVAALHARVASGNT